MSGDDVTPIRQQYLQIKRDYPNTILFFRLGDFYETFDEDAETVSRELDIVLTSRPVGKGVRAPLAGIPYHAVEGYLARLIEKGYHVAICEQLGSEPVNGLFQRKVVRVVTPGTVIEPGLLPVDSNNYLVAIVIEEKRAGVAYVDVTTGEFAAAEFALEALRAELARLRPAEILYPDSAEAVLGLVSEGAPGEGYHFISFPPWRFERGKCEQVLLAHAAVANAAVFAVKSELAEDEVMAAIVLSTPTRFSNTQRTIRVTNVASRIHSRQLTRPIAASFSRAIWVAAGVSFTSGGYSL